MKWSGVSLDSHLLTMVHHGDNLNKLKKHLLSYLNNQMKHLLSNSYNLQKLMLVMKALFKLQELLNLLPAPSVSGASAAGSSDAVDPLVEAVEEQRRVPWGGKKIDWAPPKLGFIVGVEKPTSYGGF